MKARTQDKKVTSKPAKDNKQDEKSKRRHGTTRPSQVAIVVSFLGGCASLVGVLILSGRLPGFATRNDVGFSASSAQSPSAVNASHTSRSYLAHFSKAHNDSLLWGTYRPGILFGTRSRTYPEAVVTGLMWTSVSSEGKLNAKQLRHTCEESETRDQGLVFKYSQHDGSSYAQQHIKDPKLGMKINTAFLKVEPQHWVMRVAGNASKGQKALFFYVGIDKEYSPNADGFVEVQPGEPLTLRGRTAKMGNFSLSAVLSRGSFATAVNWIAPAETSIVGIKKALLNHLAADSAHQDKKRYSLMQHMDGDTTTTGPVVVLQLHLQEPGEFVVDFVFDGGVDGANRADALSGDSLSAMLLARSSKFDQRFEETFQLRQSGYSAEHVAFAQAAMSAMIGGMGFFYGSSKVKVEGAAEMRAPERPLFTGVPSRSFFPRGFLWDEGFHQLLIGRWDSAISRDVISHWLGLMHSDGWIPREQILGAEAESKVPEWAIAQHRTHANPPTLLLAIEALLDRSDDEMKAWLRELFPFVERWFDWFVTSQAGRRQGTMRTFRWRGRDASDGKLNAMTLSSGLDDYPRASTVSDSERHVDLHSWIALGAGVLARLGARASAPQERVDELRKMHEELVASLDELHWDDKLRRYCDYGMHSNDGWYEPHIVVKCGSANGDSVEHTLSRADYMAVQRGKSRGCPDHHPQFMFPLGDGRGGLMMREKFIPKTQKEQFVNHTGYISLFPFLLRLIKPDSEKLADVLNMMADNENGVWSDYGLRSLAPTDTMYLRENAPGDAPYWRGPIWMNLNFLAVTALRHYAHEPGPSQGRSKDLLAKLSQNLVKTIFESYQKTGFFWEQYNQDDGVGQRTHPFNGWSSLVVLMMSA
eukprot:TRINITY_DN26142_c0_g1_i1.p1 TRINITY_DN26142_c0_g1~~TRINITY_DN26142_c0_g1_i1.p1  ORF type:complete len:892 (+),score=114.49 TRINITY_DN26142_c0_g1_i1:64-2676(+)